MTSHLTDVEESIADCKTQIEEFDTAINEINFKVFERVQDQFENLRSELDNLVELFDEFDKSDGNGGWSKEGLSSLGLLAQKYELARYQAETYAREIEELNQAYLDGKYSTIEYQDKLAELTQGQWDAIDVYREAEEAIVELNQARIDEEIEGIEKEIDKFKELIDAQKEALESRRDLETYKQQIADKTKSIESLEKQIAAMQYDTSASAIAKRKLLEEQLANAKQDLEDTEREHSYNSQVEALDKELEAYEKERNEEIEQLQQSLDEKEQLIADSLEAVKQNSSIVGEEIKNMAEYHGITISDAIITSWQNGENAIASYGQVLSAGTSAFIGNIMGVENEVYQLQYQANATADSLAWMFATRADNLVGQLTDSYYSEENLNAMTNALRDSLVNTLEGGYDVSSIVSSLNSIADAAHDTANAFRDMYTAANTGGGYKSNSPYSSGNPYQGVVPHAQATDKAYSQVKGEYMVVDKQTGNIVANKLTKDEAERLYGASSENRHRYTISKYAKGVHNLDKDELAWTQEYGGEMIMSPTRNAILTPLKQGDTVLTTKQTEMLYKWSQLNPVDIVPSSARNMVNDIQMRQPQVVNRNTSKPITVNNSITFTGDINDTNHFTKQVTGIINRELDKSYKELMNEIRY